MKAPDHDHGDRADCGIETAHQAFVAREQAGNRPHAARVHAEQAPRHVAGLAQAAVQRHVYAMIVVRREVERGIPAAEKGRGQTVIAGQKLAQIVGHALGLEQAPGFDGSEHADLAVHRADHRVVGRRASAARPQRVRA